MKYKSCYHLEHGLIIDWQNNLRFCCTETTHDNNNLFIIKDIKNGIIDIEKYINNRKHYINLMKNKCIPEQCSKCSYIEYNEWDDNPKIKYISIANETKCNCDCIYCTFSKDKKFFQQYTSFDVFPLLCNLKENDLLAKDLTLNVVGGECTIYTEDKLNNIVNFVLSNNFFVHFFSSGIKYSEKIAKVLHAGLATICISLDSGTKETFKKIKQTDKFQKVIENISIYSAKTTKNPHNMNMGYVILKYIIIPNINDNIFEIEAFMQKAKETNCSWIRISLEYEWWNNNYNKPISHHIYELLDFTEKYVNDFKIEYVENAIHLWNKRMKEDKSYKGKNPCLNK